MATEVQAVQQKRRFLAAFAASGNVSAACRAARVPRQNVYRWQEIDDAFVLAYRAAEVQAVDALEAEARRRATGYPVTTVDAAGAEHTVTRYSDTLLIFLLKGARPEKYRDKVDLTVSQVVREYRDLDTSRV